MDGITQLQQAIDLLASVDAFAVGDDELGESLVELHRQTTRLRAQTVRFTGAYDLRKAYATDGSRSAAARLARDANCSRRSMWAQVTLARRMRRMPKVAAAFAAGKVDEERVRILSRLAGSHRKCVADAFPEAEELLLKQAMSKKLSFDDFVEAMRYWEQIIDEDGVEDQAAHDHAARRLHISDLLRGCKRVDGTLDAIGGEIVANELGRLEQELFEADWADAKATHGDDIRLQHLARTPAQRRADALVLMARRSMVMPADGRQADPLFTILVGYETFHGRVCQLASGAVVTPGELVPWLTEAEIERIVFDSPSRVTDVGQRTRFFRGAVRRGIEVRDRHCTFPGCKVPADRCEVDHIQPFSQGGATTLSNGRLRCPAHNPSDNGWRAGDREEPPP